MSQNRVCCEVFKGGPFTSWEDLFCRVETFASEMGPERLINISHSAEQGGFGVVAVWYWEYPVG